MLGVTLVVLSIVYFLIPANSLPSFLPGHDPDLTKIHFKHGWGSLILGVALLLLGSRLGRKKPPEHL
jgi:hypothetical protein